MRVFHVPCFLIVMLHLGSCGVPPPPPPVVVHQGLLVMSGPTLQLYTVYDDGTGRVDLPEVGATPSWTADGRIIFGTPSGFVKIMDADGKNVRQIGAQMPGPVVKPQLAGAVISFSAPDGSPAGGVWLMNQDGSGVRKLAGNAGAPFLAASGRWLTYTQRGADDQLQIWRINADGTGARQLTFPGDPDHPNGNASAISPDESQIAIYWGKEADFAAQQSVLSWGHRDTALIAAGGGAPRLLVASLPVTTRNDLASYPHGACLTADNPTWSPDGKWIIYDRGTPYPGEGGTYMIDLNGKNNHRLSPDTRGAGNVPMRYVP